MTQGEKLRELVLGNFTPVGTRKEKWTVLARQHGVSLRSVMRYVENLRKARLIPSKENPGVMPQITPPSPLDGIINLKGAMTRDQRITALSDIARNSSDIPKIQAMKLLEDLERAAGLQYGPPPPTTKPDCIALAIEVLSSLDPRWAEEAISEYTRALKARPETPTPAEGESAEPSSSDLGGRST